MGFSKIAFNSTPEERTSWWRRWSAATGGVSADTNALTEDSTTPPIVASLGTMHGAGRRRQRHREAPATSVVYNQVAGKFFAALRYHGIYLRRRSHLEPTGEPARGVDHFYLSTSNFECLPQSIAPELATVPGRVH